MEEQGSSDPDDPEYQIVFAALDELGLKSLKPLFKEKHLRDKTLSFIKSEEELNVILKEELKLPFGQRFEFSRLWFENYHGNEVATRSQTRKETKSHKCDPKPKENKVNSSTSCKRGEVTRSEQEEQKIREQKVTQVQREVLSPTDEKIAVSSDNKDRDVDKEKVAEISAIQQEEEEFRQSVGEKNLRQADTLSGHSHGQEDHQVSDEIEGDFDFKIARSEEANSRTVREEMAKEKVDTLDHTGENARRFRDVDSQLSTERNTEISSQGDGAISDVNISDLISVADSNKTVAVQSKMPTTESEMDISMKYEETRPSSQQTSNQKKSKKNKKKKASKEEASAETVTRNEEEIRTEKEGPGTLEGQGSTIVGSIENSAAASERVTQPNSVSEDSAYPRNSAPNDAEAKEDYADENASRFTDVDSQLSTERNTEISSQGDGAISGVNINDLISVADSNNNPDKTVAVESKMPTTEREMDTSVRDEETRPSSQQTSNKRKSKRRKKKKASKEEASTETVTKNEEEIRTEKEGPGTLKGQVSVNVDHPTELVAEKETTLEVEVLVHSEEQGSMVVTKVDQDEDSTKGEESTAQSAQGVTPLNRNTYGNPLLGNATSIDLTVEEVINSDSNNLDQTIISEGKVLSNETDDQERDSVPLKKCTPRPHGVAGRETSYNKGAVLDAEENRELEFKSLVNAQQCCLPWKIMEKAKKFICACLNADRKGIIYFGVGDSQEKGSKYQHGEILGLDVEHIRDDINKAFQFVLDDHIKSDAGPLQKGGEQNCVSIHFVPVMIQGTRSSLYVIEIEVARDWRFCKENIYYSKSWIEKRGADKDFTGKKALSDFFKVKDEFDDVAIRTNGASSNVKQLEVDRQVKKPLEARYKEWRRKTKHGANELPEELNLEDADAKRFGITLRERLRELNHKEYGYILVANKLPAHYRGTAHLSFLQNIPWVAVFDLFDSSSKRDGLHYACNETTDAPRAKIRTLDDFKDVSPDRDVPISTRGTTWIFSNEEMQKEDWIKCSKDCLYRALSAYKQCFLPGRLLCVFLCFSESAVNEMADIMESSFSILGKSASTSVTIISESRSVAEAFIKVSKPVLQRELGECSVTGIPWILLKEIVREMVGPSRFEEKGATTELPYFTGQLKEVLSKIVHSWSDLEVYCPNPRLPCSTEAIEKERDAFYKGAQASQINLLHNHSIPRSLEKEITAKVERALKSLSKDDVDSNYYVKTVTVSYEPGSGATTLCRRILWNKRKDYRCAVVKAITSSTDYQIDKLQSIAYDEKNVNYSLPVLVLVDNFPESDVRLLTEHIMKRHTKCVVLTTLPISNSGSNSKFEITLGKLDAMETSLVKNILINITSNTERRREAEQVLEREKRFIWFGLELFGREYLKIRERLQNHIHSILMAFLDDSRGEHQMLLDVCCFLNKYSDGSIILPHSAALEFLYETHCWAKQPFPRPAIKDIHEVFGGLLLEEQNQTNGYYGWRPAHSLVSEVVTSRIGIEDTAILSLEKVCKGKAYAIKFLRQQVFRLFLERKRISDPVFLEEQTIDDGTVGSDLENEVFGFYGKRTRYSPVILDIVETEGSIQGALKVLLTICEQATQTEDKAYAWQQLARFMGYQMRANSMDKQDDLHKRLYSAMTNERPVKMPMPRNGIDAAHTAVDIAVSLQPNFRNHYTTKGVLYLLQLGDCKPSLIGLLPEAIETCRKALSVYDKALETSRGPNHFSMIGKIQAIILLLEIIKNLPCFHFEVKTFVNYLKREEVPPDLAEVLSLDEQDYVQSLSSTTLDLLNELFRDVKLKQTTTYDENEIRGLNNAKIRASNLRRKFYEITGFDKRELSNEEYSMRLSFTTIQDLALYQQKVQDILFIRDETPYSTWSNLSEKEVEMIYQLLKSLCVRGRGSHNDMLICSKACLQRYDRPPVDELNKIVTIWVEKYPNSEWAHLFYYMIHFPIPNGSLAPYNPRTKASIKKCGSIVQEKAGSGFRKSGAEYFLGKGIGLNAIVSSQEFRWLETKWKTKTEFWRSKEPSERLERVQGQKDLGSKGIISYQGIQIHFDNTLYPNESKDDLWFYVGFTVAGPYAYDPVDNDTYATLNRSTHLLSPTAPHPSETSSDNDKSSISDGRSSSRESGGKTSLPRKHAAWHSQDLASEGPKYIESRNVQVRRRVRDEDDSGKKPGWIAEGVRSLSSSATATEPPKMGKSSTIRGTGATALPVERTIKGTYAKAVESLSEADKVKDESDNWKSVLGSCGSKTKLFIPRRVGQDGKLHHGAFVLGARKSKECFFHSSGSKLTEFVDQCDFAHGWKGDTLQFVCTKCTDEGKTLCKEKVKHEKFIWNLGPYYDSRGDIWKDEKGS